MARPLAFRHARKIAARYLNGNVRRVGSFLLLEVPRSITLGHRAGEHRLHVLRGDAARAAAAADRQHRRGRAHALHARGEGTVRMARRLALVRPHRGARIDDLTTQKHSRDFQRALADAGVDGWLLYDFRGLNPIAGGLMRLEGMTTRRVFASSRRAERRSRSRTRSSGAVAHWPTEWTREIYSSWRSLEALLAKHVAGKRVAMEYSAGDAVPYLDRVPAGVIEMVRAAGATVVSSGELVSRFYAAWNAEHIASHLSARRGDRDDRARRRSRCAGERRARPDADRRARADGVDSATSSRSGLGHRSRSERVGGRERGESALRAVGRTHPRVIDDGRDRC